MSEQGYLPISNANLLEALRIVQGDPRRLDADSLSILVSLPDISKAPICKWAFTDSGKVAGYDIRRREGRMGAADGSQFAQAPPEYIIRGVDKTEGLQNTVCNRARRLGKKTHVIKEVHQPSQLFSLKARRILFTCVVPN